MAARILGGGHRQFVIRLPMACSIALASAAIGGQMLTSPTPFAPYGCAGFGTSTSTASIIGRSDATGAAVIQEPGVIQLTLLVVDVLLAQDVGRAIHPSYVEGQIQGGVVQGIGWALNEEDIYNAKGQLDNPGFLDYRCPVASDLPMIDAVLVEVPNPAHPYGAKGVGEVNICPPMAAIANAIDRAIGVRMNCLPMSPPRLLEAIDAKEA